MSYLDEIYQNPGRTVQLFLPEGHSDGLKIATLHGWAGSVMVATNSTLPKLLKRDEAKRTGVYVLFGPDPEDSLKSRVYIGEADEIVSRLPNSAGKHEFWETVAVITANDESLTKSHVRFLEAVLIRMAEEANRANLENVQKPDPQGIHMTEADKANMFDFLRNIRMTLPVVGLDFLKPAAKRKTESPVNVKTSVQDQPVFELNYRKGTILAQMEEQDGEYIVLKGSMAVRNGSRKVNNRRDLRENLIEKGKLILDGENYVFTEDVPFKSISAAATVIMDGNANGREWWKVKGSKISYNQWQLAQSGEEESVL